MSATLVPDGMERTEAQFRTILGTAGFSLEGITPTASPVSVVEARPIRASRGVSLGADASSGQPSRPLAWRFRAERRVHAVDEFHWLVGWTPDGSTLA